MKAGTTQKIRISLDVDLNYVDSIIFTLDGATRLTKIYPGDVEYSKSRFEIPLTQQETLALSGEHGCHVFVETQINFKNKAVAKSEMESFYAADTLATAFVEGNTPDDTEKQDIALVIEGSVVYAGGGGGTSDYNRLDNKPQINGVELQGDVSLEGIGVGTYVSNYVEEHKSELKGEPGKPGADGKDLVHVGEKIDNESTVVQSLKANVFCLLENAVANLVVKFPANYSFFDEFLFSFIAGTSCSLIVPEQVKWMNEPSIEAGLYYEVSIVNDIAVISKGVFVNE